MLATIGLIALGGLAGAVIYHFFILSKHGGKSLAHQLDDLKKEHQKYQYDVAEHFQQTTEMLENLNEQYQMVQLHIQSGAELLAKSEPVAIDQVGPETESLESDQIKNQQAEEELQAHKPKDYA